MTLCVRARKRNADKPKSGNSFESEQVTLVSPSKTFKVVCPLCGKQADLKEIEGKPYYVCEQSDWNTSKYNIDAELEIVELLRNEKVAFRNEIRYRLEKGFPYHTTVDYAIRRLEGGKAYVKGINVKRTSLPGRKSSSGSTPNIFYKLPQEPASKALNDIMKEKLSLSTFVTEMSREAGFHAQVLWREAYRKLGYEILKENTSEFQGRKSSLAGNIDFIAVKDGLPFGVEVKNKLSYPDDLGKKFQIAAEIKTIPVMVVRKVSPTAYSNLRKYGALVKIYETAIFNLEYKPIVDRCAEVLGSPLIALDEITMKTLRHTEEKVMAYGFANAKKLIEANQEFLEKVREYEKKLKSLGKELRFL